MSIRDQRPKHKPSPKHTLDEVLKSLQDLIRNNLVDAETASEHPPPGASRAGRAAARAKTAATTPASSRLASTNTSPPATVGKILDSLRDLITHELGDADTAASVTHPATTPAPKPTNPAARAASAKKTKLATVKTPDAPTRTKPQSRPLAAKADSGLPIEAQKPATPAFAKTQTQTNRIPRGGLQTAFPFSSKSAEAARAAAADETDELEEIVAAPPPDSANWDDIPVLEEIAAHPDEEMKPAAVPAPGRAREIAVKVVAKLNIELRKCGERALDPRTIDRLQSVLREALEAEGANVDNKPGR